MKMNHKFFLVLFSLLILPNAALSGLFNRGVDVEGRMLASAQTANAYYSVLGLSAPMHYSQLKTPIKKNVIAYFIWYVFKCLRFIYRLGFKR